MNPAVVGLVSLGAVVFGVGMLSVFSGTRQHYIGERRRNAQKMSTFSASSQVLGHDNEDRTTQKGDPQELAAMGVKQSGFDGAQKKAR